MSESPGSRIHPSIVASLIGLVGTIIITLISVLVNRPGSPQATAVPATKEEGSALEIPTLSSGAELPAITDGKLFKLFYDDNSLYLLNLSDATIPINRIAFERLSNEDVPLNRFNGTRWAEFYAYSTPGKCVAIQILGSSPYLDPAECGHNNFLSLRTPARDDPTVFWTAKEGSHQFRVLWREGGQDEEIARCEIGAETCEVFLP
jgi:hypothetical protein